MRPILPLLSAACCVLALSAAAETVVLSPAGPVPVTSRWQSLDGAALAPGHPLAPAVRIEDGAVVMETRLADGRVMRLRALGIHAASALPRADVSLAKADGTATTLSVLSAWRGVDEVFTLRADAVKHDLVVGAAALTGLGSGDLVAEWSLELPAGARAVREELGPATSGLRIESADGRFLARLPAPSVRDADDSHGSRGLARLELGDDPAAPTVRLVVSGAWAQSAERALPLLLDPTVSLQPTDQPKTGFVDEFGNLDIDQIDSGSLSDVGFGSEVRGFAEFPLGSIPDAAVISNAHLRVWLSNHDNPLDPAVPLGMEIKQVGVSSSASPAMIHAAIAPHGTGVIYASEDVPRTGPEFCPDSYEFRDYDLGALGRADVMSQLPFDYFMIGFTSEIVTDPGFDHIDYIGYMEQVLNPFTCPTTDFPGTRITLVLEYEDNTPPVCDAGGPYLSDCPSAPIPISASASSDPDGDPLTFAWTTSCSGFIENPAQADAILHLDSACGEDCTVTVAVSDGVATTSCTAPVSAHDTEPPVVTSTDLAGFCTWPPRHDLYCVTDPAAHVTAADNCGAVTYRWLGCLSDQPDEAREAGRPENGDGNFPDDCQVSPDGQEICIRVERAGSDPVDGKNTFEGRHYGVGVEVSDGCGNAVVLAGTVFVPHDRRGGSGGQDDPCGSGSKIK